MTLLVSIGSSYVNYRNVSGDYQGIARQHLDRRAAPAPTTTCAAGTSPTTSGCSGGSTLDLGRTAAADQPTDVRIAQHASVNDPQFSALLFQYGRYLLISSSRPGTQPANLQGIWNDSLSPSWDSKYTHQRQPADELLAGRHHEPGRVLRAGVRHDQRPHGHRRPHGPGAVRRRRLGHPPQHRRMAGHRPSSTSRSAGMWQTGGAWLATMIWDHYLFTGDIDFLQANYPAMKGAAQFFLDTLVAEPTLGLPGHQPVELAGADPPLRTSASAPARPWTTRSCATCSTACAQASQVLGVDADFRTQVWPPGTGSPR